MIDEKKVEALRTRLETDDYVMHDIFDDNDLMETLDTLSALFKENAKLKRLMQISAKASNFILKRQENLEAVARAAKDIMYCESPKDFELDVLRQALAALEGKA